MRTAVPALLAAFPAAMLAAGCAAGPTEPTATAPTTQQPTTAAPTTTAGPYAGYSEDERGFLRAFDASYSSGGGPAEALRVGEFICDEIRSSVRPAATQGELVSDNGLDTESARALYFLARGQLCPEAPIPDNNSFTEGVYQVGVDMQPGTYRSPGGEDCYWARLDENQDIVDNYLGSGPSVLVVQDSDAFVELSRCTWTLSQ